MSNEQNAVVIDLTETEDCTLTPDNEVSEMKVTGVLSVINPSSKSKIWNAVLKLDGVEGTNLSSQEINVGEVSVKGQWTLDYTYTAEQPLLKVQEIIDTAPQLRSQVPHDTLAYGIQTTVEFVIKITNVSDAHITSIQVLKSLPAAFGVPEIEKPTAGKVIFHPKNRELIWKDFELYPNGDVELRFKVNITPEQGEPYSAGGLSVSYVTEGKTRSSIQPYLDAETSAYVGGSEEEDPKQPNRWICYLDFLNDSDFALKVNKAVIYQTLPDGKRNSIAEEEPGAVVAAGESWRKEVIVESPEPPILDKEVDYSVEYIVTRKVIGHIEKQPKILPVLKIEAEKAYKPPEVDAYTKTPMTVVIQATNTGSAVIDEVTFIDEIPVDFKPSAPSDIRVFKGETPIKDVRVERIPDDDDSSKSHTLTIVATNLVASVGGINPGEQITCEFPIFSWSPRPTTEYVGPFSVKANSVLPVIPTVYEGIPVKIGIKYVPRKIARYKTVLPGQNPGEFVIPLRFINRGEVAVENVTIIDYIPPGYNLVSWEPEELKPEVEETPEGTNVMWTFKRIEKGNEISLKYVIQGKGTYVRREPMIVFGKESSTTQEVPKERETEE
ncbi:MAG: hypothetical protein ACP6IU_12490 [Candidatus Asgardarchaeia archaeon]